jgi:hypothetical protein
VRRLVLVLLAACGAGSGTGAATASGSGTGTATATVTATATAPGGAAFVMKDVTPTAYGAELTAIGLDPSSLPSFDKVTPDQLRKLMPLFAKSLGLKCDGCHDMDAPAKRTHRKDVAMFMWKKFLHQPTPVFCDSCHHGGTRVLDRSDDKALRAWMDQSFVHGLGAKDCAACHGEPFNPHVIPR